MNHMKKVMFLVIFASVAVFLWMNQQQTHFDQGTQAHVVYAEKGHEAPDFQAYSFNDELFKLSNNFDNDGTVLYFWTSWCPYCKVSSKAMETAYQSFDENITIIGINVTNQDRLSEAEKYIKSNNLHFKNLIDHDGGIARSYFVPPIPTTLFIDGEGKITFRKTGAITYAEIEQEVHSLLREER